MICTGVCEKLAFPFSFFSLEGKVLGEKIKEKLSVLIRSGEVKRSRDIF